MEFLTLKNPVENWFTFSLSSSTKDKARQISKLGWSLFTGISNVGTPVKYWSSSKELVWKTPTSRRLSIIPLLNFPGFGPKWPPSDGVGLHGSLTIVNHPDPFEFMVRLPSSTSTFAMPSLLSPKINSGWNLLSNSSHLFNEIFHIFFSSLKFLEINFSSDFKCLSKNFNKDSCDPFHQFRCVAFPIIISGFPPASLDIL